MKQPPKLASQFWPAFFKKTISLSIIAQILISAAISLLTVVIDLTKLGSTSFWTIFGLILLINILINTIIFVVALKPTKDLMAAIVHVSGEKTAITPPNPNTEKNERNGFKDALQTIYELASKSSSSLQPVISSDVTAPQASVAVAPDIKEALDETVCGFITMNEKRIITYANKSAPVHIDPNGQQTLDLLFNGTDTLDAWLKECDTNAVHADKIWTRIPDRLPNEENRRFFDVIASYQKGAKAETVLTLIDRTGRYALDEESLDFIAFAAHELRGPITVIRGYLEVLGDELEGVLKDDQHELFRRLIVSSNRLSGYINNILNTSRYDRRHLMVHLSEDTLAGVYDMITDDMQLRAGAQGRLLSVNIPADLPTIAVDRASMSEVLGNLIDNAIKYSNEGGAINVTAKVSGEFVEVSIEDHGIGMPESVVSQLFQKFYRSHRSRETVAGTGIGLYISKAIVESHGGNISVRSQDGHGSTFTVSLPIYATVAQKLKAGDNSNKSIINEGAGWIKNHSMYRS
ncbi:MAG: HAMP domain-containing sensor histidine kinase [Candidatus Saccharimonadales bacterium]